MTTWGRNLNYGADDGYKGVSFHWLQPPPGQPKDSDKYIVSTKRREYWLVEGYGSGTEGWVAFAKRKTGETIAGPFKTLKAAKAAWLVIYGSGT